MTNSPGSPSTGTMLADRYRLDDLLSEHGGARFWRATDTTLARSVALHVVASSDPRASAVLAAARRSAGFSDPRFLRVLDCDDADGITWVVHEWGDGLSLDVMLAQGPLPPMRAAWLAREVAGAIAAAHAADLHHGRLNPEAVMVTASGTVRIIGFLVNAAFEAAPIHPAYGPIGERATDVVDLAGILYAALTGRWPGITPSALPAAPRMGRRPLRPRQVRAGVPRTLDAICDRVLHKEASQHILPVETAFEISAALSDYVGDLAGMAPVNPADIHTDPETSAAEMEADPAADALAGPPESGPYEVEAVEVEEPAAQVPDPPEVQLPDPEATMAAMYVELDELIEPEVWQAPAPPPPHPELPVRPLFAEHERRIPVTSSPDPAPLHTPGGGWPFDNDLTEVRGGDSEPGARRRSRWVLVAVVVFLILLGLAGYAAFRAGQGNGPTSAGSGTTSPTPTPGPTGTPIKIVGIGDFDPEGNPPQENPDQARLAIDGNPKTGWQTSTYRDDPHLGGLKSGVGLVVDLGATTSVGSVSVVLIGAPTDLELYGTAPGVNDPPVGLTDARRIASLTDAGTNALLRVEPAVRTRYLIIWLTKLPRVGTGFRGEVAEITVRP